MVVLRGGGSFIKHLMQSDIFVMVFASCSTTDKVFSNGKDVTSTIENERILVNPLQSQ